MMSRSPSSHGIDSRPRSSVTRFGSITAFCLSFRDAEDLLVQRGVTVTYETIRQWCRPSGRRMRERCGATERKWATPGIWTNCSSRSKGGSRISGGPSMRTTMRDILVQSRRDRCGATRFFRKLLKRQGAVPRRLITDKLRSYASARRAVMPSVVHVTNQYANNRAEVSHQPTRQRERQTRRFKSAAQVQRVASVHRLVQNLFRVDRHLLRSAHRQRPLRREAFGSGMR